MDNVSEFTQCRFILGYEHMNRWLIFQLIAEMLLKYYVLSIFMGKASGWPVNAVLLPILFSMWYFIGREQGRICTKGIEIVHYLS